MYFYLKNFTCKLSQFSLYAHTHTHTHTHTVLPKLLKWDNLKSSRNNPTAVWHTSSNSRFLIYCPDYSWSVSLSVCFTVKLHHMNCFCLHMHTSRSFRACAQWQTSVVLLSIRVFVFPHSTTYWSVTRSNVISRACGKIEKP